MKKLFFAPLLLSIVLILISCNKDQDKDLKKLDEIYSEIKALADSQACENPDNWSFTAYGSKACGGPVGFIAYSLNIDEDYFLALVAEYTEKQEAYNLKWGINSDCSTPEVPTGIVCENNLPVFVY